MLKQVTLVFATLAMSTAAFAQQDGSYQIGFAANLNIGDSEVNISNDGDQGGFYNNNTTGFGAGNICVNAYVFDPSEEEIACCSCLVTPNALVSLSAKNSLIADVLTPAIPTSIVIKLVATTATIPSGASNHQACSPNTTGGVSALAIVSGGTGYTSAPTVMIVGGGGSGASANAVVAGGVVIGFTAVVAGSGYTSTPTVVLVGGGFTTPASALAIGNFPAAGMLAWGTTLEPATTAGTYGVVNVPFINGNLSTSELTDLAEVCSFVQQEGSGFGVCKGCALGALSGTKQ